MQQMVASWILNSICKELAGIWRDLQEQFSQGNGPGIFQIQKASSSLMQKQSTLSSYFTRLKSLWEELSNYKPSPVCSYGAMKQLTDFQNQECIMQFLMRLNDTYSSI